MRDLLALGPKGINILSPRKGKIVPPSFTFSKAEEKQ
jgi:hypothetical protein